MGLTKTHYCSRAYVYIEVNSIHITHGNFQGEIKRENASNRLVAVYGIVF